MRPPKGTTHVVLDTPAGLHGKRMDEVMKLADKVLVPLQPSIFDIHATSDFIRQLLAHRRSDARAVAIVGMRTREGTIATDQLRDVPRERALPLLGFLRDTQNYVHLAAHGLTLWDVALEPLRARPRAMGADHPLGRARAGHALRAALRTLRRMRTFQHLAELRPWSARRSRVSDWITVDQARIDQFADATGDHQWIHVDPVRAAAGPFGATVAHGFLTLSLLPEISRRRSRCATRAWA